MHKPLLLCVLVLSYACANENEQDDLQQVQQFAKSVKGGLPGGFQYNPGANLIGLFNHSQQEGHQDTQRTWNQNQDSFNQSSWNQYQQNQAAWNQSQQSWNQQHGQAWNQQNQGWNQYQGQGQAGYQGQGQTGYNQGQAYQGQTGQGYQGQTGQGYQGQGYQGQGYQGQGYQGQGYQGQGSQGQGQAQQGQGQAVYIQGQAHQGQFGNNQVYRGTNGIIVGGRNTTGPVDLEVGVCYIEVPTVRLVQDPTKVPAGNGSRPDLSRIRSCCQGYIRNIYNFKKCDPVCTKECVNALCTAPETCSCFPDHVKNLAGICVPTCPIGCQNGLCEGGKCTCKNGFKLHQSGQFCMPECKGNCGGIGNCTEPNTCECKPGYESTPDGSCRPHCDNCENGVCVSPNVCECHKGYNKDKEGKCASPCGPGFALTPEGCSPVCHSCFNGDCIGPNNCQCRFGYEKQNGFCEPACNPSCGPSSRCISPNVCDPPRPNPGQVSPGQLYPNLPKPSSDNQQRNGGSCSESQPCLNGLCVEHRCQCNNGYELDKNDASGTRCIPRCAGGCQNGVCSAPDFCICNVGYVKDHSVKGRPTCVKRVRRSVDPNEDEEKPVNVAKLLTFEIPEIDSTEVV